MQEMKIMPSKLVSATEAIRNFAQVKKRARKEPVFIISNNTLDVVVVNFEEYQKMNHDLEEYRNLKAK